MKRCCLVVGHRPSAPGAVSAGGISEYYYNQELARQVVAITCGVGVQVVYRDDHAGAYSELPAQINALEPDFIVSLHFNAFDGEATGSEVLYWHTSEAGERLACICLGEITEALHLPVRGVKPRKRGDRGGPLLGGTRAPCVIAEPFFGDNRSDWARATSRKDLLGMAYKRTIEQYAKQL